MPLEAPFAIGFGEEGSPADLATTARGNAIGCGMVIAAAIIVRTWGDDVQATEILGAAGLTTMDDMRRIGAEAYDVQPLRGVLRGFARKAHRGIDG